MLAGPAWVPLDGEAVVNAHGGDQCRGPRHGTQQRPHRGPGSRDALLGVDESGGAETGSGEGPPWTGLPEPADHERVADADRAAAAESMPWPGLELDDWNAGWDGDANSDSDGETHGDHGADHGVATPTDFQQELDWLAGSTLPVRQAASPARGTRRSSEEHDDDDEDGEPQQPAAYSMEWVMDDMALLDAPADSLKGNLEHHGPGSGAEAAEPRTPPFSAAAPTAELPTSRDGRPKPAPAWIAGALYYIATEQDLSRLIGISIRQSPGSGAGTRFRIENLGVNGKPIAVMLREILRLAGSEINLPGWDAVRKHLSGQAKWWKNPNRGGNQRGDFTQVYLEQTPGSFKQMKDALLRAHPGLVEEAKRNWREAWDRGDLQSLSVLPARNPPGAREKKRKKQPQLSAGAPQSESTTPEPPPAAEPTEPTEPTEPVEPTMWKNPRKKKQRQAAEGTTTMLKRKIEVQAAQVPPGNQRRQPGVATLI